VVRPRSCRVIYYFDTPAFGIRHQLFDRVIGATYRRAMLTLFHNMMHKEIEVYVDDMIAKSREGESCPNIEGIIWKTKEVQVKA